MLVFELRLTERRNGTHGHWGCGGYSISILGLDCRESNSSLQLCQGGQGGWFVSLSPHHRFYSRPPFASPWLSKQRIADVKITS